MKTILASFLVLMLLNSEAQVGKTFPQFNGSDLADKAITIPEKNGKYTIIAIAYLREAEPEMRKWLNPLYEEFVDKDKGGLDMSELREVNFYFVPMISGLKNAKIDYKKNTDKGFWPYVIDTEKYDIKTMQKEFAVENPKVPYFYVLDKDGKIVNVQSGKFSEAKVEQMSDAVQ